MLCHLHQSMITAMAAFETVYELRLLDQTTEYFVRAVHLARVIDIHSQSILLMNVLSFVVLALIHEDICRLLPVPSHETFSLVICFETILAVLNTIACST